MTKFTVSLVRDTGLSRVSVSGPDAMAFLNAQSMTALAALEAQRVQRCGFADSKGRVIATATAWHTGTYWRLILPTEEADWWVAHLLRLRFRAQVEIGVNTGWTVAALFGNDVPSVLHAVHLPTPEMGMATATDDPDIALTADGRCLIAGEAERMPALLDTLSAECAGAERTHWYGVCMRAGEVAIYESTRGHFLPQFLDFDTQGVIAWNKGCYPGQEIIARLRYRGTVKHRLVLLATALDAPIGACADVAGVPVDVVDHGTLENGRPITQVVAPCPPDARLNSMRL
jgi:folate-binding protein YgfZ